jgi:hypothetical protein
LYHSADFTTSGSVEVGKWEFFSSTLQGDSMSAKGGDIQRINFTGNIGNIFLQEGADKSNTTVIAKRCNSYGCSGNSIDTTTGPPCYPPRSYVKDGLCWACPFPANNATPAGCLCPPNTFANATSQACQACPEGKSNDGTGLTDVSQCLGPPSSLSVLVASNDSLRVEVGSFDFAFSETVSHYQLSVTDSTTWFGTSILFGSAGINSKKTSYREWLEHRRWK